MYLFSSIEIYVTKVMCHYSFKTLIIKFVESLNLHITPVLDKSSNSIFAQSMNFCVWYLQMIFIAFVVKTSHAHC